MRRLWFITNPGSGSTTAAKCEAIEAVFGAKELDLAGRTRFPEEPLPDGPALDAAAVDTVVLFAGDGTINAALCHLARWTGAFLILPGGTMNLLAKSLHGETEPADIIKAAHDGARITTLSFVEAGPRRAFVGLIVGPAGSWYRAREAIRSGRLGRLAALVRLAWRQTFRDPVTVRGVPGLRQGYQAIFIGPGREGIDVAAVDARDWTSIAELGWEWLRGDWVSARAVTHRQVRQLTVAGRKAVLALFDGEPESPPPGTVITGGVSTQRFIATGEP